MSTTAGSTAAAIASASSVARVPPVELDEPADGSGEVDGGVDGVVATVGRRRARGGPAAGGEGRAWGGRGLGQQRRAVLEPHGQLPFDVVVALVDGVVAVTATVVVVLVATFAVVEVVAVAVVGVVAAVVEAATSVLVACACSAKLPVRATSPRALAAPAARRAWRAGWGRRRRRVAGAGAGAGAT